MRNILAPLLVALPFLAAAEAPAAPVTIDNTTIVDGSDGTSYGSVGADFQTPSVAISGTQNSGGYALTLAYTTTFDGLASSGDVSTYYPDIFLRAPASSGNAQAFGYAVSLGDEDDNGGTAPGFYTPDHIATSQSIWSGRGGYNYGAAYTPMGGASYAAPVVMLAGAEIAGTSVTSTTTDTHHKLDGSELYTMQVTISGLSAAIAASFSGGLDAFWGTGDCANGAFLATDAASPFFVAVPEPADLVPAVFGLVVFVALRRRRIRPFPAQGEGLPGYGGVSDRKEALSKGLACA
jgi:hypothetical protein